MRPWIRLFVFVAFAGCGDDATPPTETGTTGASSGATDPSTTGPTSSGGAETQDTGSGEGTASGGTSATDTVGSTDSEGTADTGTDTGTETTGGVQVSCNPTLVLCDGPIPECPPGEVPEVVDGCWGQCVPILECATEPSCDDCQGGFCAAYEGFTVEYRCVMPTLMCSALQCSCLAPYFCVEPFDACSDAPEQGAVSCGCPSCDG